MLKPLPAPACCEAKPTLKQINHRDRSLPLDPGEELFLAIKWKNTGLLFTWIWVISLEIAAELGVSLCFPFLTCVTEWCQLFPQRREPFKSKWRMQISWQWVPSPHFQNPSKRWQEGENEREADGRRSQRNDGYFCCDHQGNVWKRWHFYGILVYCEEHFFLVSYILASLGNLFLKGKDMYPNCPSAATETQTAGKDCAGHYLA